MSESNKFELITLPYSVNELEPVISAETLKFHHGKHLLTYVNNLNNLISNTEYEAKTLEEIVKTANGGIANNAGQILNHNLYFTQFGKPVANNKPIGELAKKIDNTFGSFDAFKEAFAKAGTTLFGSGWVWLSCDKNGELVITQEPNATNPIQKGLRPLLTMDVWEHAYYLDYQNRRLDHLSALWSIINWEIISERYTI